MSAEARELGAALLLVAAIVAVAGLLHCGGSTPGPTDVALYSAEQTVCVVNAKDYDAGEACLRAVRSTRCGPGGLWVDASPSVCPDGGAP